MNVTLTLSRTAARRVVSTGIRRVGAKQRFVILTTGRTGSELLVSLLDSHPQIACDSEILAVPRHSPGLYVLGRSALARRRGAAAYGLKVLPHHAALQRVESFAELVRRLHARGFRIVLLERRDWLGQALSSVRAGATQHHHRRGEGASFSRMSLDPVAVLAALLFIEEGVAAVRDALQDIPRLELTYEEDLATPERQQATAARVCNWLGLAPARVHTDLLKLPPPSVVDQIDNPGELVRALAGTRFATLIPQELEARA